MTPINVDTFQYIWQNTPITGFCKNSRDRFLRKTPDRQQTKWVNLWDQPLPLMSVGPKIGPLPGATMTESNQIPPNLTKYNQIQPSTTKYNQIEQNQTKSNQIQRNPTRRSDSAGVASGRRPKNQMSSDL